MQVLLEEGTQEGGVQKDEVGHRCRQVRQEWQANWCQLAHSGRHDAALSTIPMQQMVLVYFPSPAGSQSLSGQKPGSST